MGRKYKVWVHVEEIDEEGDFYGEPAEPLSIAEFETLEQATALQYAIVDDDTYGHLAVTGGR